MRILLLPTALAAGLAAAPAFAGTQGYGQDTDPLSRTVGGLTRFSAGGVSLQRAEEREHRARVAAGLIRDGRCDAAARLVRRQGDNQMLQRVNEVCRTASRTSLPT